MLELNVPLMNQSEDLSTVLTSPISTLIKRKRIQNHNRPTEEFHAQGVILDFVPGAPVARTDVKSMVNLGATLRDRKPEHFRWMCYRGDVPYPMVHGLASEFDLPPSVLACVVDEDLVDFPGHSWVLNPPERDPIVCVSVGVPLPHVVEEDVDTDIAKIWVHVVLVGNTMITFSKSSGCTMGMFESEIKMNKFLKMYNDLFTNQVIERLASQSTPPEAVRWAALMAVLTTLQASFLCPAVEIQQHLINRSSEFR